MGARQGSD